MAVIRIVPNLFTHDPQGLSAFYAKAFGLDVPMTLEWIATAQGETEQSPQLTLAREGGSNTPLPVVSIEVDDLDHVLNRLSGLGVTPIYGPVVEPWGVRRFYFSDPAGHLINVLSHEP